MVHTFVPSAKMLLLVKAKSKSSCEQPSNYNKKTTAIFTQLLFSKIQMNKDYEFLFAKLQLTEETFSAEPLSSSTNSPSSSLKFTLPKCRTLAIIENNAYKEMTINLYKNILRHFNEEYEQSEVRWEQKRSLYRSMGTYHLFLWCKITDF